MIDMGNENWYFQGNGGSFVFDRGDLDLSLKETGSFAHVMDPVAAILAGLIHQKTFPSSLMPRVSDSPFLTSFTFTVVASACLTILLIAS